MWRLESIVAVQCLLDTVIEGPKVCGKAQFGSGHPELLFPQMEMKGCYLAQPEPAKLRCSVTW